MKWNWLNAFFIAFSVLVVIFIILFVTLMSASNKLTARKEGFQNGQSTQNRCMDNLVTNGGCTSCTGGSCQWK